MRSSQKFNLIVVDCAVVETKRRSKLCPKPNFFFFFFCLFCLSLASRFDLVARARTMSFFDKKKADSETDPALHGGGTAGAHTLATGGQLDEMTATLVARAHDSYACRFVELCFSLYCLFAFLLFRISVVLHVCIAVLCYHQAAFLRTDFSSLRNALLLLTGNIGFLLYSVDFAAFVFVHFEKSVPHSDARAQKSISQALVDIGMKQPNLVVSAVYDFLVNDKYELT